LEGAITTIPTLGVKEYAFDVHFDWDMENMGIPGAFTIQNHLLVEFFLVSLTLEDVPNHQGPMHFVCNSWVYSHNKYEKDRIFFSNEVNYYLQLPGIYIYIYIYIYIFTYYKIIKYHFSNVSETIQAFSSSSPQHIIISIMSIK